MSETQPKVTINTEETPTAQAIRQAMKEHVVTDSEGRIIKLRKPGVLAQYRLIETLEHRAKNETYMNMVLPLLFVCEISGEAIFQPSSMIDLEFLIQRLDDHGVAAVINGVMAMSASSNPEADKEALKK